MKHLRYFFRSKRNISAAFRHRLLASFHTFIGLTVGHLSSSTLSLWFFLKPYTREAGQSLTESERLFFIRFWLPTFSPIFGNVECASTSIWEPCKSFETERSPSTCVYMGDDICRLYRLKTSLIYQSDPVLVSSRHIRSYDWSLFIALVLEREPFYWREIEWFEPA